MGLKATPVSASFIPTMPRPDWADDEAVVAHVQKQMIERTRQTIFTGGAVLDFGAGGSNKDGVDGKWGPKMARAIMDERFTLNDRREMVEKARAETMPVKATTFKTAKPDQEHPLARYVDPSLVPKGKDDFIQKTFMTPKGEVLYTAFQDENGKVVKVFEQQYNVEQLKKHGLYISDQEMIDRSAQRKLLQVQDMDTPQIRDRKNAVRGKIAAIMEVEMRDAPIKERVKLAEGFLNRFNIRGQDLTLEKIEAALQSPFWQTKANGVNGNPKNLRALNVALMGTHIVGAGTGNEQGGVGFGRDGIRTVSGVDGNGRTENHGIEHGDYWAMRQGRKLPVVAQKDQPSTTVAASTPSTPTPQPTGSRLAQNAM